MSWLTLMIGCTLNGMKFVLPPYIGWWWLRTLWNSDGPHWWIYGPLTTNFMTNYTDWRTVVAMGPTFTVSDSAFYQQYIEKSDLQGANQSYRYQRDAKVLLHCCTIGTAPKIFSFTRLHPNIHYQYQTLFQLCLGQLHKFYFFVPAYLGLNFWIGFTIIGFHCSASY